MMMRNAGMERAAARGLEWLMRGVDDVHCAVFRVFCVSGFCFAFHPVHCFRPCGILRGLVPTTLLSVTIPFCL